MNNESKRQRISTPIPTTLTTDHQTLHNEQPDQAYSSDKGNVTDIAATDVPSNLAGDADEQSHRDDQNAPAPLHQPQLPNELVSLIIDHLPDDEQKKKTIHECTLVNKQFHGITNPLLWKAPDLGKDMVSQRFFTCLSEVPPRRRSTIGQLVRDLRVETHHWTDQQLLHILPHLRRLDRVTINGNETRITDRSLQQLPRHCQRLTSLALDDMELSQVSFASIGHYCRRLVELELSSFADALSPLQVELLGPCPLEHLQIVSDYALPQKSMTLIKTQFHRLTTLSIEQIYHRRMRNPAPRMKHLLQQPRNTIHWPQLTKFSLKPCKDLDDATLVAFVNSHRHLQALELYDARKLTNTALDAMADSLQHLTRLDLTCSLHISSVGVRRLVQRLDGLDYVNFSFCDGLEGTQFPELPGPSHYFSRIMEKQALDTIRQIAARE